MNRILSVIFFIGISLILNGQNPDLGLNGTVTWIDSTHISVEYNWSNDSQLLDWVLTPGSTLVREPGFVTITNGSASVRAMVWKQGISCSKIIARDATALTTAGHHLNFYTNLTSFTGSTWLPNPGLGAVLADYKNFWEHNGTDVGAIGTPYIVVGIPRDYELTVSETGMTIKSSVDDVIHTYSAACSPELERKIALGGWGGNTKWGKITIEGEVVPPEPVPPVPSDMILIKSSGAVFGPVIEVSGTPVIQWIFNDSTTSSSTTPVKNYGTIGSRNNYLKVTPWSSLIGINVGYDAADGGYGDFAMVGSQNVTDFKNLTLAKSSLQYLCASYNFMAELDLRELTALQFVELYKCSSLARIRLGTHPDLQRLCVEDCNLDSLDLSGCSGLEDLRAALNSYTRIEWSSIGQLIWHICIRDNPQITENLPDLVQFPVLMELLNWNTNQTGAFVCHSSVIQTIDSYSNHYTSADISGCTSLTKLSLSGSLLNTLDIGTASSLYNLQLKNCGLTEAQVDYVLNTLDLAGKFNGYLYLKGNTDPSTDGLVHMNSLTGRGWSIDISPVTGLQQLDAKEDPVRIIFYQNSLRVILNHDFISGKAELFNSRGQLISLKPILDDDVSFGISTIPAGIYLVVLSDSKHRITEKVFIP